MEDMRRLLARLHDLVVERLKELKLLPRESRDSRAETYAAT
jgi:hypothetical protein